MVGMYRREVKRMLTFAIPCLFGLEGLVGSELRRLELRDPFHGREDLERGILRAVGEPEQRFREDALRILRGLRFSSKLGFAIEAETAAALRRCAPLLKKIAVERIQVELNGLLCGRGAAEVYAGSGGKPEGIPIELADVIIRILDYCGYAGIDIEAAIRQKHEYNKSRPYRHGGKKC